MVEMCDFTFANKNSSEYGIVLCDIGGLAETLFSGADSEIISDNVFGNSQQLVYGVKENGQVEFQLKLLFPEDVGFETVCDIKDWLFRHNKPQKLIINHPDLQDYYFWCFLRYGDDYQDYKGYRVMSFTVQSISPYAYKEPVSSTFQVRNVNDFSSFSMNVNSSEINDIKPTITIIQQSTYRRDIEIQNITTNTQSLIKGNNVATGEEINVSTQNKTVYLAGEYYPNHITLNEIYGFIYLTNGVNKFNIKGWADIVIEYTPCRRIGGV